VLVWLAQAAAAEQSVFGLVAAFFSLVRELCLRAV